jgi:hypothetical protein
MGLMLPVCAALVRPWLGGGRLLQMGLTRASLHFDFERVPYAVGVIHIHSPERIASVDSRMGPLPLFRIDRIEPPRLLNVSKPSIAFECSSPFTQRMQVRMYSTLPNESQLLCFKDRRALCAIKLTVIPLRVFQSHRLRMDMQFFAGSPALHATLKGLLPFVLCIKEDAPLNHSLLWENPHLAEYRRAVLLRGLSQHQHWVEHVLQVYGI